MRSSVELDVSPPLELERMAGGELVAIRTAQQGDEALLRELALDLARTRRRARHLGWMGIANRIPRPLKPLTHLESLEECLVAIDPRDGHAIGMASIAPTPGEPAVSGRRCSSASRSERDSTVTTASGFRWWSPSSACSS
jgi:hypothetical protein